MAGRPKKNDSDRKTVTFRFRVTESERDQIEQAAKNDEKTASDFVRKLIMDVVLKKTTQKNGVENDAQNE